MKTIYFVTLTFLWSVYCEPHPSSDRLSHIQDEENSDFPKNEYNGTLRLVSVIFRHGNRTTVGDLELYPNDPYLNYTYFPLGYGQLTNAGKVKTHLVGTALRKRYNSFLGKLYYPQIVEAITTNWDRTKASLQLALAGLFPPTKEEVLATGLTWQPIPYKYEPLEEDRVLQGTRCPKYAALYNEYVSLPKALSKFRTYQQTFEYISRNTGLNIKTTKDVYNLYLGLATEEEYGLALPKWTKTVWPETISRIAVEEYFISMGTQNMRKIAVGYFLEKLLKDINTKLTSTDLLQRKIHLHAAHESTIAQLLVALGVFEKRVPTYGSYVIVELHKIDGVYGVKLFQESWDGRGVRLLKIPGCKEFCSLDAFKSLISDYLPVPGLCE